MLAKTTFYAILVLISLPRLAFANDAASGVFGLIGINYTQPYKGLDSEFRLLPLYLYNGKRFYSEGDRIGYNLTTNKHIRIDVMAQLRIQGYEARNSVNLLGMKDRDSSIDAGFGLSWRNRSWNARVQIINDILNKSAGLEVNTELSYEFQYPRTLLTPYLAIEWQNDELTNYYYGVRASETMINRLAYRPGASTNYGIGIRLTHFAGKHYTLVSRLDYVYLDQGIYDSPIVSDRDTFKFSLAFGRRF